MKSILQPWQLLLIILAGWMNRRQQQRIDYLETVVTVLKEHNGMKRILLTDDQRRCFVVKGKILGRKQLSQVGGLFTPDTILRWHRSNSVSISTEILDSQSDSIYQFVDQTGRFSKLTTRAQSCDQDRPGT